MVEEKKDKKGFLSLNLMPQTQEEWEKERAEHANTCIVCFVVSIFLFALGGALTATCVGIVIGLPIMAITGGLIGFSTVRLCQLNGIIFPELKPEITDSGEIYRVDE